MPRKLILILRIFLAVSLIANPLLQTSAQSPMFKMVAKKATSSVCSPDADAQKFIDSTGITGVNATAICNLVKQLKDSSIWNDIDIIYPFISSTSSTQAFNLKNPAAFKLAFNGTWTHDASGADPAAANTAYATTGYIPSSSGTMTTSSSHIAIDILENSAGAGADNYDIGTFNSVTQSLLLSSTAAGGNAATRNLSENILFSTATTIGLWVSSHTTSTATDFYYNNAVVLNSGAASNGSLPSVDIYLANINLNGGGTYSSSAAGRKMDFVTAGAGLSAAKVSTLYNIISIYKTAIGR